MCAKGAVKISCYGVTNGFNAKVVPVVGFENGPAVTRKFVSIAAQKSRIEPQAPLFVINAARPPALIVKGGCPPPMIWAWVDEHQISIHPTLRNGQGTSVPLPAFLFRGIFAADLDAREKLMIRFEIKFKNEIIIVR